MIEITILKKRLMIFTKDADWLNALPEKKILFKEGQIILLPPDAILVEAPE